MNWSPESASNAYLDIIKLLTSKQQKENMICINSKALEPESTELLSALAAGMSAKLMVEVASEVSSSKVALAAAARQTGGNVVCIIPESKVNESKQAIEFKTGDPGEVLPNYENVDFSVVYSKMDDNKKLLETLDVNPENSVVVTNNLPMVDGRKSVERHLKGVEKKAKVRSKKHHIGNRMEISMTGKNSDGCKRNRRPRPRFERKKILRTDRSNWITMVDDKSGEEHIFRIPKTFSEKRGEEHIYRILKFYSI